MKGLVNKFYISQMLVIKDPKHTYTLYDKMFEKLDFYNKEVNPALPEGTVVQVFAWHLHEEYPERFIYAVVDSEGNECLMAEEGLSEVEFKRKKREKRVKISSDYTAIITDECIQVGCQRIEPKTLKEIVRSAREMGLID